MYSAESQSVVPAVGFVVVSAVEDLIAAAYFCANRAYLPANFCGIRAETAQKRSPLGFTPNRDLVSAVFNCFDKLFLGDLQIKAVLAQIVKHGGYHIAKHIDNGIICGVARIGINVAKNLIITFQLVKDVQQFPDT